MASYFRQLPNFDYISRNPGDKYISEYIPVKNLFKRGKLREDIFGNLAFFEKYTIIGDERPDNIANKFYGDSTLDWVILLTNNIINIQSEWPVNQNVFGDILLEKYGSYDNLYNIHHYETNEIKNSLGATVIKSGIQINPTWKTNGNFIETINSVISDISSSQNIVTVSMNNSIPASSGDQIIIDGVSEIEYNGKFTITSIFEKGFTYNLPQAPVISNPVLSTSKKEQVIYTIPENSFNSGNAYYYEYWDPGLGYSTIVPSTEFIREVTNYEYELKLNEKKRNIFILKPKYLNIFFNDMDSNMPYKKGSQQYVSENLKRGDNIRLYE